MLRYCKMCTYVQGARCKVRVYTLYISYTYIEHLYNIFIYVIVSLLELASDEISGENVSSKYMIDPVNPCCAVSPFGKHRTSSLYL